MKHSRFVIIVITSLIINDLAIIEAKRGGSVLRGRGSIGGGRVDMSRPRIGSNTRVIPRVNTGTLGRNSGRGHGSNLGRSALTGALAGLAAGYVGAKIGRHLTGAWYDGRYYWFGDRYYSGANPQKIRCVISVPQNWTMTYEDGSRVKEVIYECNRYSETCCVDGCCYSY